MKPFRFLELDRFFDDFLIEPAQFRSELKMPKMDIKEYENKYDILVEIPGIDKEDIEIEIHNDILAIKSEKETKKEEKDEDGNYIYRERSYRNFNRQIRLPDNVKKDDVKASMDKGILKLELLKSEPKPKKKIEINEIKEIKELKESKETENKE